MGCGCAADGGEPRNTVGGALSEAAATCSGEPVAPRNTSVEEASSADAEGEATDTSLAADAAAPAQNVQNDLLLLLASDSAASKQRSKLV